MALPLTKIFGLADYSHLVDELSVVDSLFHTASPQVKERRWEYALAIRAARTLKEHGGGLPYPPLAMDVGGSGSPLQSMLEREGFSVHLVDPRFNFDLGEAARLGWTADFVACVSVIEHVPDLYQFIADLGRVTKQGGVLFLTTDIWDRPDGEPDKAHWHWLRERIFTPKTWEMTAAEFCKEGFTLLGEADFAWTGCELENWGYGLASLALVKERRR